MTKFVLRQALSRIGGVRVGRNLSGQLLVQRTILTLCALVLLLVTLWGNLPVFARYQERRAYQVSPLQTPVTVTTNAIITGSLNAPTSPLTTEVTAEVTTGVTTGVTVAITSVITTAISTATTPITNAAPVLEAPPRVDLVNRGQTSLWLVGAVLVGLLVLVGVVIRRQRA